MVHQIKSRMIRDNRIVKFSDRMMIHMAEGLRRQCLVIQTTANAIELSV